MQPLKFKLYPHKLLSNTLKCILAGHIYDLNIELKSDFNYLKDSDVDKINITYEKPLLLYDDKSIATTKAICFFFYRLRNENKEKKHVCDKFLFNTSWINWCETLENYIRLLNKNKIIEVLNKLDSYIKENINESFMSGSIDLCLADIYIYVQLVHSNIEICSESWKYITNYIKRINDLEKIQQKIKEVKAIYDYENRYKLFISKILEKNINEFIRKEKFYIATAIYYVNGEPHMGHAYEIILADSLARYNRNLGKNTYFTTGADEHGIKILNKATSLNLKPLELCNINVEKFHELNKILNIQIDYYTRTSREEHKSIVCDVWKELKNKDNIYLGEYEGWYNIREETYVTEKEAALTNYMDVLNNVKLEKVKEPSYFFKMGKYQEQIINHLKKNKNFIIPEQFSLEILQRLKEPLTDLSCSRISFDWGIKVPDDSAHVMYVWLDALLNYYSSCYYHSEKKKFWPPDVIVIGKDIIWFHSVILTSILLSYNVQLPKLLLTHGFILASDGKKMSKSLGNVIDPVEIIQTYGCDSIRYYLIKETNAGTDLRFDSDNLVDMCNSDLADIIGNLINRILSLCISNNNSKIPDYFWESNIFLPFNILEFMNKIENYMNKCYLDKCCKEIIKIFKILNKTLTELAPWKYKEDEKKKKLHIIRLYLEAIYFMTHYLDIIIPNMANEIFKKLNTEKKHIVDLSLWLNNLKEGTIINNDTILYKKIDVEKEKIKIQKVIIKVCKIIEILNVEKEQNFNICNIEIDNEKKCVALVNTLLNEKHINQLSIALINIKPFTIKNYNINALIPHVNNNIFIIPTNNVVGTLIKPKGYTVLAKPRDKLTKKEISLLNFSIIKKYCFFENNIPLVYGNTEQPLIHTSEEQGIINF